MQHIVAFSGGKDSQAVLIWAKNNLPEFNAVFCDTGHESEETYNFVHSFCKQIEVELVIIESNKYEGFMDLSKRKNRFPSSKGRFCTEELKVKPMIDYILDIDDDLTIYQGIRHEESKNRASMQKVDNYFKGYFDPISYSKDNRPRYYSYRKKEIVARQFETTVVRPIITWTTKQVFEYIRSNGFDWNPLYNAGFSRVGCFPCVMCRHSEILNIARNYPKRLEYLQEQEKELGRSFFPPNYIPKRFCKNGEYPTIAEVIEYLEKKNNTLDLFQNSTCKNAFMPCE